MKVLVIGGGGREHAVVKALKTSPEITELYYVRKDTSRLAGITTGFEL